MIIEVNENQVAVQKVKDFKEGTALFIAAASRDEETFPNCERFLVIKIYNGVVFLDSGIVVRKSQNSELLNWKAIEANVKIVNN